jgi:tRNA threonylcarbamoyladenosine biosynthesis protein TsaE
MKTETFTSHSSEETIAIAKKLAKQLKPGTILALEGDLGAGKTTFIKGIALGFGLKDPDEVKSPTFALMHIYPSKTPVYHFDFYRLENEKDVQNIGFLEFAADPAAVTCVEWPQRAPALFPPSTVQIRITSENETTRRIEIKR